MRKRGRSKEGIIIDLTSLLDVIFIILLVVLCRQQIMSEELENKQAKIAGQETAAAVSKELYEDQLDTLEYVTTISVSSSYSEENITTRTLSVLSTGEKEAETYRLVGRNVDEPMLNFRSFLVKTVEASQGRPVLLSLNEKNEKMLYRDEVAIQAVFGELCETYSNVFIKYRGDEVE